MSTNTQPWPATLGYQQRFTVVRRVLARHRDELLSFPGVIAVGLGLEYRGRRGGRGKNAFRAVRARAEHPHLRYVPCIHVIVKRKWRTTKHRPGSLPDCFQTTVRISGKRIPVSVPVDVLQHESTRLHAWESKATRDADWAKGSGTCFVRAQGSSSQYLLGCHHVLALTETLDPPDDLSSVAVTWEEQAFGELAHLPEDAGYADAALAINRGAIQSQVCFRSGGQVIAIAGALRPLEVPPPEYVALTRRGVLRAHFVTMTEHTERYFSSQTELTFEHCIASLAQGGESFMPGDSGAALVAQDGRLLGLHFAGSKTRPDGSFAIHAAMALSAFDRRLAVW